MEHSAFLNNFAVRSFRDVADQDYISARLSYRAGLISQFQWSSLQAIEKYIKAILLINKIEEKDINHSLSKGLEYIKKLPFPVELSKSSINFINHLEEFARFRYLEVPYYTYGPKLVELDKTVWEMRRYCTAINYEITHNGKKIAFLDLELKRIKQSNDLSPHNFRILGGLLETILSKPKHPARPALIWQNAFFTNKPRKIVKIHSHYSAVNPPLSLHPDMLDVVNKYVYLPKEVIRAYRDQVIKDKKEQHKNSKSKKK